MKYADSVRSENPIWTSLQWLGALGCVLLGVYKLWGFDALILTWGLWCGIDVWVDNLIRGMEP